MKAANVEVILRRFEADYRVRHGHTLSPERAQALALSGPTTGQVARLQKRRQWRQGTRLSWPLATWLQLKYRANTLVAAPFVIKVFIRKNVNVLIRVLLLDFFQ